MRTIVYRLGQFFSPPSSSSQEKQNSIFLPAGEREKRYLDALNSTLNIISEDKFESLPSHIDIQWDVLSERTRNAYNEKDKDKNKLSQISLSEGC